MSIEAPETPRREPVVRPYRGPSAPRLLVGVFMVAAGLIWLVDASGVADVDWEMTLSVALIGVGVALFAEAWTGRRNGGLIVIGAGLAALLVALPTARVTAKDGIAERNLTPRTVAELSSEYRLASGAFRIDLTQVAFPEGTTEIEARVGLGEIVILVPLRLAVEVTAESGLGQVDLFGRDTTGAGLDETYRTEGFDGARRRLKLDLRVGLGQIEVRRGS